jgi:hypothetical protein
VEGLLLESSATVAALDGGRPATKSSKMEVVQHVDGWGGIGSAREGLWRRGHGGGVELEKLAIGAMGRSFYRLADRRGVGYILLIENHEETR